MLKGSERHFFPGGNTSRGFYSFYNYVIDQEEAERKIILKGGPGVGKSTFMRKLGNAMLERGYDVEFMHCSSDSTSLDAIAVPALKLACLDGTAPHIVDPKLPGAVDEIINFGEFWGKDGIKQNKEEIIKVSKEISSQFSRAYKYLAAASYIYEDCVDIHTKVLQKAKLNIAASQLIEELIGGTEAKERLGKERSLFASAITPDGLVNYLETILTSSKIVEIRGGLGTGEEILLEKIKDAAIERGCYVEAFFCALNPEKLEHLLIPEMDVSFTTSNDYHKSSVIATHYIFMQDYMNQNSLSGYEGQLAENKENIDKLITIAQASINKAKELHDELESFYIPNIDFSQAEACCDKLLKEIEGLWPGPRVLH
jgi:GTPase SAR1 family protein